MNAKAPVVEVVPVVEEEPERFYTLTFPQLGRAITCSGGESLYHSARRHGVRVVGACGGRGTCGTCLVRVTEGKVAPLDPAVDPETRQIRSRKKWLRACEIVACSDCELEIAPRSLAAVVRAEPEHGGDEARVEPDPAVVSLVLQLPEPTLDDPLSDLDRIARAGNVAITSVDLHTAQCLSHDLRAQHWSLRAHVRNGELIGIAPAGSRALGLAVDFGTTNVAGFLMDLTTGERLAGMGIENPQAAWGADLISRINHAISSNATASALHQAAVETLNVLAFDLCHAVHAKTRDIVDVVVCGNTAMHHLLLGLPVRQLGRAPFVAGVRDAVVVKARDLKLNVHPGAYLEVVANVGGFVGGDHTATLLATEERWAAAGTSLAMDIGTNTEISLIHNGRILSASAPSGPALEGGHIACGMRAAEGAIERVGIADGRVTVQTIGGQTPIGLCGSGVLDTLATLHRGGLVDDRGRLAREHPDIVLHDGKRAVRLAPDVFFTQEDVRAVQLAKAAIRTAVDLLLDEAGVGAEQLDHFVIAGAFGAYIDVTSAVAIGMLPALPAERFSQVGNAAGIGVRRMVVSQPARTRAREIAAACGFRELSSRSDFQKRFLDNIGLHQKQ